MKNNYNTVVRVYEGVTPDDRFLGFEVPEEFLTDMDLKPNEVLNWEIDTKTRTVVITKTNTIVSD